MAEKIITLTGSSYYVVNVDSKVTKSYVLNPIDNNGNLFPLITIQFNTDDSGASLQLPKITAFTSERLPEVALPIAEAPSKSKSEALREAPIVQTTINGRLGFTLKVACSGENSVNLQSVGGDLIGKGVEVTLEGRGASAVLTPITDNIWSADISY